MNEPTYTKCAHCTNDFSCFFQHATRTQKHDLIMSAAKEVWKQQATLAEHMSKAAKARHAKRTPEERSAYAKMMVQAREAKRADRNIS